MDDSSLPRATDAPASEDIQTQLLTEWPLSPSDPENMHGLNVLIILFRYIHAIIARIGSLEPLEKDHQAVRLARYILKIGALEDVNRIKDSVIKDMAPQDQLKHTSFYDLVLHKKLIASFWRRSDFELYALDIPPKDPMGRNIATSFRLYDDNAVNIELPKEAEACVEHTWRLGNPGDKYMLFYRSRKRLNDQFEPYEVTHKGVDKMVIRTVDQSFVPDAAPLHTASVVENTSSDHPKAQESPISERDLRDASPNNSSPVSEDHARDSGSPDLGNDADNVSVHHFSFDTRRTVEDASQNQITSDLEDYGWLNLGGDVDTNPHQPPPDRNIRIELEPRASSQTQGTASEVNLPIGIELNYDTPTMVPDNINETYGNRFRNLVPSAFYQSRPRDRDLLEDQH
ncbi:hypothetical protein F5Y16DRAFT_398799 [Xylariaceae sp. FL0255]|nr:hypothetical protein F5Y16DRAFT_398799 [Xylariaceae sp. FL0255]